MDLLNPTYERRTLEEHGFDEVAGKFKRLSQKELQRLQNLSLGSADEDELMELLPKWVREIEGVSAGEEAITNMDRLVRHDEVPAALVQAFVVELITGSVLSPKKAKNS